MNMCILWTFSICFSCMLNVAFVSAETPKQIMDYMDNRTNIIRFPKSKDITVILGDTPMSDKIVLQLLMFDPTKLNIRSVSGQSKFVDQFGFIERYSTSTVPELIVDKKSLINYYAIPSLNEKSDVKMELSAAYLLDRVLTFADGVKFLFTVDYSAVSGGKQSTSEQKKKIQIFLTSVTTLLATLDKYLNSIALVITNVNKKSTIQDVKILNDVADAFKSVENEVKSNPQKVKLIKMLVKFNGTVFEKMAVHRQAYQVQSPDELDKWLSSESSFISFVTHGTTEYVKQQNSDFVYSISDTAKKLVPELLNESDKRLTADLPKVAKELEAFYIWIESKTYDMSTLFMKAKWAYENALTINSNDPRTFSKQLSNVMETLQIEQDIDAWKKTKHHVTLEQFLNHVIHRASTFKFADSMKSPTQYLKQSMLWYKFMLNLFEQLSAYQLQEYLMVFINETKVLKNEIKIPVGQTKNVRDTSLKQFVKRVGATIDPELENAVVNSYKWMRLKTLLIETMDGPETTCLSNKLIVKGHIVRFSDFIGLECSYHVQFYEIFAMYKIIVDANVFNSFNKSREKAQVSIIAPTWEVGQRAQRIEMNAMPTEHRFDQPAADGTATSPNGTHGLAGMPGTSAGRVLLILQKFINEKNFHVEVKGGKGGYGQNGGAGFRGSPGTAPNDHCGKLDDCLRLWKQQGCEVGTPIEKETGLFQWTTTCTVTGTSATKLPGAGGDGGKGGEGGYGGLVKIIKPSNSPINLRILNNQGDRGGSGFGGFGGAGTRHGDTIVAKWVQQDFGKHKIQIYDRILRIVPDGMKGATAKSSKGLKLPNSVHLIDPSFVVNNYKNFFREQFKNSIRQLEISNFYDEMIENVEVHSSYDALGLINEFDNMEKQYLKLRNKFDFVPHIKSVLSRTKLIRDQIHSKDNENATALDILRVALYSKLVHIEFYENRVSVTDLLGYMKLTNEGIKKLKDIEHAIDWHDYQTSYKKGLDNKINIAHQIIAEQVQPAIDKIFHDMGNTIGNLIDDIIEKEQEAANHVVNLTIERTKLEHELVHHFIMNSVSVVTSVVSMLGPVGAAAGGFIQATADVVNSVSPEFRMRYNTDEDPLVTLKDDVGAVLDILKRTASEDHRLLLAELNHADKLLEKKPWAAALRNETDALREKLKADLDSGRILNPNDAAAMRKEYQTTVQKLTPVEPDYEKVIKGLTEAVKIVGITKNLWNELQNDEKKIKEVGERIENAYNKITEWKAMQDDVFTKIIPTALLLQKTMENISEGLKNQSHVELDVTKWKVKGVIRDIKRHFVGMIQSTDIQSQISEIMNLLDEAMSVLINIFDRIDSYKDNAEFAQYIANMLSKGKPQISDPKLSQGILTLQQTIHQNLVLHQYSVGINALKQHYFPFAKFFLNSYDIETKSKRNDIKTLINNAIRSTEDLIAKIGEAKLTVGKYQKDIFSNIDFKASTSGQGGAAVPFHQWKYEDISDEMERFFNGEVITLRANLDRELHQNKIALKFNTIKFSITSADKALASELESLLQKSGKSIRMSMIGNCYYRCGERFYYISVDDNLVFEYSTEINPKTGLPARTNDVYKKIMGSAFFLSPYTMWKIQLRHDSIFPSRMEADSMRRFLNSDLRVELTGRGQYFVNGALAPEVCTEDLAQFYHEVSDNFQTKAFDYNPKELLEATYSILRNSTFSRGSSRRKSCHQNLAE